MKGFLIAVVITAVLLAVNTQVKAAPKPPPLPDFFHFILGANDDVGGGVTITNEILSTDAVLRSAFISFDTYSATDVCNITLRLVPGGVGIGDEIVNLTFLDDDIASDRSGIQRSFTPGPGVVFLAGDVVRGQVAAAGDTGAAALEIEQHFAPRLVGLFNAGNNPQ